MPHPRPHQFLFLADPNSSLVLALALLDTWNMWGSGWGWEARGGPPWRSRLKSGRMENHWVWGRGGRRVVKFFPILQNKPERTKNLTPPAPNYLCTGCFYLLLSLPLAPPANFFIWTCSFSPLVTTFLFFHFLEGSIFHWLSSQDLSFLGCKMRIIKQSTLQG